MPPIPPFISPGFDPGFGPADTPSPQNPGVGYDLGESFGGFAAGNTVVFRARPKNTKGQPIQRLEGTICHFERRWGEDFASVRGRDGQFYDVRLVEMEIADVVSRLGNLANADDD